MILIGTFTLYLIGMARLYCVNIVKTGYTNISNSSYKNTFATDLNTPFHTNPLDKRTHLLMANDVLIVASFDSILKDRINLK